MDADSNYKPNIIPKILLVTGSREWNDEDAIRLAFVDLAEQDRTVLWTLVHGGCRGADLIAEKVAKELNWKTISNPADWKKNGVKAGLLRNIDMIRRHKPHHAIAFHLDNSRGTQHCINELNKYRGQIDTRMKTKVNIVKK